MGLASKGHLEGRVAPLAVGIRLSLDPERKLGNKQQGWSHPEVEESVNGGGGSLGVES